MGMIQKNDGFINENPCSDFWCGVVMEWGMKKKLVYGVERNFCCITRTYMGNGKQKKIENKEQCNLHIKRKGIRKIKETISTGYI